MSGEIKKTEYKGAGSGGQHDDYCNPSYESTSGAQGSRTGALYQLSQIEAIYCANRGETWQWIINHYYDPIDDPTGWHIEWGHVPAQPSFTASSGPAGRGKIYLDWFSQGVWHTDIYFERSTGEDSPPSRTFYDRVGWVDGEVKTDKTVTGLTPGQRYTFQLEACNPSPDSCSVYARFTARAGS